MLLLPIQLKGEELKNKVGEAILAKKLYFTVF